MSNEAVGATVWQEGYALMPISGVIPYPKNPRKIGAKAVEKVAASIREFGFNVPILIDEENVILAGHTRRLAAISLGLTEVPVIVRFGLTETQKRAYRIADNRVAEESGWDKDLLRLELSELDGLLDDLSALGFDDKELEKLDLDAGLELISDAAPKPKKGKAAKVVSDDFQIVPTTVLDTSAPDWKAREQFWSLSATKIASKFPHQAVLAELIVRWFSPLGGTVLGPFSGNGVMGAVASRLGREYTGFDIDNSAVSETKSQFADVADALKPAFFSGNARAQWPGPQAADLVICDLPRIGRSAVIDGHMSGLSLPEYVAALEAVAMSAEQRLKPCRFCVILIQDSRMPDGALASMERRALDVFESTGLKLYNSAVVLADMPAEVGSAFVKMRRLSRRHKSMFVLVKGDPVPAARDMGHADFGKIGGSE